MNRILIMVVTALMLTLAGCNTMQGIGEDIESAGKAIKKKASE